MSLPTSRKRGANYTHEEKTLLIDLLAQYKHIIECKRTGSIFIAKKREAWKEITIKYNSNCTSGPRDTDQLKALYDNMKQKTRKDVGESNKLAYINAERMLTQDDVAHAIKNIKDDKIEMNKTGGGYWKPKTTDNDAKLLAIIQDQVKPLCNPYDSASGFFNETSMFNADSDSNIITVLSGYDTPPDPSAQDVIVIAEEPQASDSMSVDKHATPTMNISATPKPINVSSKKKAFKPRKIIKKASADTLKRLYFKKKCQNADLEKKKLMMEILYNKREHLLKMELLKNKKIRT